MSGYARFHRSLIGHPAFRNDAEAMAFAYMVLRASWKDTRVRYKGRAVELRRGQLSMSQRDMADALDRDKAWVERLWKRLRDEGMVSVTYEAGAAVITICNYDKFQHSSDEREAPDEAGREAAARQTQGTEQVREEYKEESNPPTPRAGGRRGKTRIPEDWAAPAVADLPPKARACAEQWTSASYETHAEAFVSYWRGTGKMMTDWGATWANRIIALHSQVLRDQKFGNAPIATPAIAKPMTTDAQSAYLEKLRAAPHLRGLNTIDVPRTSERGPPRPFAQLAAGIASGARVQ